MVDRQEEEEEEGEEEEKEDVGNDCRNFVLLLKDQVVIYRHTLFVGIIFDMKWVPTSRFFFSFESKRNHSKGV